MKWIILNLFLFAFTEELKDVDPEVDKFMAELLKPYLSRR